MEVLGGYLKSLLDENSEIYTNPSFSETDPVPTLDEPIDELEVRVRLKRYKSE